jgi:hypothetical protein
VATLGTTLTRALAKPDLDRTFQPEGSTPPAYLRLLTMQLLRPCHALAGAADIARGGEHTNRLAANYPNLRVRLVIICGGAAPYSALLRVRAHKGIRFRRVNPLADIRGCCGISRLPGVQRFFLRRRPILSLRDRPSSPSPVTAQHREVGLRSRSGLLAQQRREVSAA